MLDVFCVIARIGDSAAIGSYAVTESNSASKILLLKVGGYIPTELGILLSFALDATGEKEVEMLQAEAIDSVAAGASGALCT